MDVKYRGTQHYQKGAYPVSRGKFDRQGDMRISNGFHLSGLITQPSLCI